MIGYYVHHHGRGHLHRATAIAAATRSPVVGFSSLPRPPGWRGRWIELPDDATDVRPDSADVTAGGTLHWVPRRHDGLRVRTGLIGEVLAAGSVRAMVVDVSVEVALLARLHGIPVVVVAQPGDRTDPPHRLAYDLADRLLAPWPPRPAPGWPRSWLRKTVHLGALSRFDDRVPTTGDGGRRVLALWGSGGLDVGSGDLAAAAAATPGWRWDVVGPVPPRETGPPNLCWRGWLDGVWPALCAADVVVTHAGMNALAEVAAARRPAVVIPQRRPHGEQRATAAALDAAGIGVVADAWPAPEAWPGLLDRASHRGGDGWRRWSFGDGTARAAAVLDALAETGTGPGEQR